MQKDFYLDERGLAAYFEKDWFDQVIAADGFLEFAPFENELLYSDYHERLVEFVECELALKKLAPKTYLEIGSSLGRTYYQVCKRLRSVESATLVEPSQALVGYFEKIFRGREVESFQVLKGNGDFASVTLNTRAIQEECGRTEVTLLNQPFQGLSLPKEAYDLVVCSNVIDQCKDPRELARLLQHSTAPNGVLVMSCTYQWQDRYVGSGSKLIKNLDELMEPGWIPLNETNIPFKVRVNERHWMQFLSHVVVYRKAQ
jgi:SAM-dependent methyltransferase